MIEVPYKLHALFASLAVVCVLSIVGSFICWVNDNGQLNERSQLDRWKWMTILFMVLYILALLGEPNHGS